MTQCIRNVGTVFQCLRHATDCHFLQINSWSELSRRVRFPSSSQKKAQSFNRSTAINLVRSTQDAFIPSKRCSLIIGETNGPVLRSRKEMRSNSERLNRKLRSSIIAPGVRRSFTGSSSDRGADYAWSLVSCRESDFWARLFDLWWNLQWPFRCTYFIVCTQNN